MTHATRSEVDDRDLIGRVTLGDELAFAELYRRYAAHVRWIAQGVLVDRRAAEDVTQEVFASLWQHPDRVDLQRGGLRTLLMSMARYRAIDAVRRETSARRRHDLASRQPEVQPDCMAADVADTVAEAYARLRRSQMLRAAVEGLPEPQRTSVELAYFSGHTFCEVARITGVPEGTAKSRLTAALHRLERQLAATLGESDQRFVTAGRRAS